MYQSYDNLYTNIKNEKCYIYKVFSWFLDDHAIFLHTVEFEMWYSDKL